MFIVKNSNTSKYTKPKYEGLLSPLYALQFPGADTAYNCVYASFHINCVYRMYTHHKNKNTPVLP